MPGFWDYFSKQTESLNASRDKLFERQFNIANMWNQNAQQEGQAARDYLNLEQGLFGKTLDALRIQEAKDQFNKTFNFDQRKWNEGKIESQKDRDAQIRAASIGRGGGSDNFARLLMELLPLLLRNADGGTGFLNDMDFDKGEPKIVTPYIRPTVTGRPININPTNSIGGFKQPLNQ